MQTIRHTVDLAFNGQELERNHCRQLPFGELDHLGFRDLDG